MRRTGIVGFLSLLLVIVLANGAALGYWSSGSVPGGNGAAAATAVNQGATPDVSVTGDGSSVVVAWAETTLTSGQAVGGYRIERHDLNNAAQTVHTDCAGTVTSLTCTEHGVPDGTWRYSVTPVLANWSGPRSLMSVSVRTDATAPVSAITLTGVTGGAFRAGDTVYYRGASSGSFTLSNAVSDAGTGPAWSETGILSGTTAGWTHTSSRVSTPAGGPYLSDPFSWAAGTSSAPSVVVTSQDDAGNSADTTLSFVNDSTSPNGGSVSYLDGYQPEPSVVVTFAAGTDSGSGVASSRLQLSSAVLGSGTCGAFTEFSDVLDSSGSPYTHTDVDDGMCYQYRLVVTDRVGNQDVVTSAGVAKVDPVGRAPLRSAASFSVLAGTDVVNTGGLTSLSGDVGVSPAGVITGFPPGIVAGDVHTNDAASSQALADVVLAYDDLDARTTDGVIVGDLGGQTFHAGVHHTSVALGLTGTVTLDAEGDPTAVFVFQTDAAFNTAAGAQVNLVNGAQAANVFWQVQGAVGTGASTVMSGTILSAGAITLGQGTTLIGRALSKGTVTMANTTVRFTSALPPSITITGGSSAVTKDPTPTIAGTTTAPAGRSVTVTIGGQVLSATVQADGTWSVSAAELAAGTYPVLASVRGAAGNAGNATQTLVVEANPDPVQLGTAGSYSVLAATGVVNTGPTTVSGDLGVSPGTVSSISGFPPGIVAGGVHANDAAAIQARADLQAAYDELDRRLPHRTIAGDLGGQTFHAGVHHTSAALGLTGTVTLDAEGDPTAVFVFQTDAALNTAAGAQVKLVNGAQAANVFWQVQGAVGTGASTVMSGTILSAGAITLGQGTTLIGRALSKGTVTMATTIVLVSSAPPPTLTVTGGPSRSTLDVTPTISGTTSAGAGRTVTVRVDGQVLSATVQGDGTWSVTAAMLLLGNHAVTASVRDAAGNAGAARQTLSISLF